MQDEGDAWVEGATLDDPQIAAAVLAAWREAATLAGESDVDTDVEEPRDVRSARALLDEASAWVVRALEAGKRGAQGRLLVTITRLQGEVRDADFGWRARALTRVHGALGRLRGIASVDQLMDLGPGELCVCGFDRVMITQIEGSRLLPQVIHVDGDPDGAQQLQQAASGLTIELDHLTSETEMLRRPGPLLVADAQNDERTVRSMVQLFGTRSYVAAPIMPQGKVIGFLHADCFRSQRMVDEFDRDLLWAFAEGFGYAWERAVLLERLRTLRQDVRRGHTSVLAVMEDFSGAGVELVHVAAGDQSLASTAAAVWSTDDARIASLLTPRELDVMRLMAQGDSNPAIATTLVVSEGTVKSHVKHILRKLRAKNRAEAVSRFIATGEHESAA